MKNVIKLSLVALAAASLIGCASKPKPTPTTTTTTAASAVATPQLTAAQMLQQTLASLPNKVYFGFDQYNLTPAAIAVLQQNAAVLLKNPQVNIMLAGNADPRGSEEYNFHLGMKRAKAVYSYFMQQGIPASQMCMVSYGELRPAATPAQMGGNWQKAYALDRRTEINYNQTCQGAGVSQ
jgi:peptidoglycan-associated lipoprotein